MTHTEAREYLLEVYTDNEYFEDYEWTFQNFLNDIFDGGADDYSDTVIEAAKIINYTA